MKTKIYTVIACLFLTTGIWAQAPQKMSYQAVVRDSGNELVVSTSVGMQISILQGTSTGTAVYVETQTPSTNANGLVSLEIGTGSIVSGDFSTIDWGSGPYFIKTETDPTGGTSYTIEGTSELMSVPYTLYSENGVIGGNTDGTHLGEILYWNGSAWTVLDPGATGQVLTMINGGPAWGGMTAVGPGEVQNPITGAIWMDRNLGASQVAVSKDDVDAFGDLYQWGRDTDGHEKRTSNTTAVISTTPDEWIPGHADFILSGTGEWHSPVNPNLWQGKVGVNNPCPFGYRLPTDAEMETEYATWSTGNDDGAFASPLKFTAGGRRQSSDGAIANAAFGFYWTSNKAANASMFFTNGTVGLTTSSTNAYGSSVRCIKN